MNDLKAKISREAKAFQQADPKKQAGPGRFRPRNLPGLLVLQGPDFVTRAFELLLERRPGKKEKERYMQALVRGRMNRVDVLGLLRRSQEGRQKKIRLRGLYILYFLQAMARRMPQWLPLAAALLRRTAALGTALVRALAPDQAEFIRDQAWRGLESRLEHIEEQQKQADHEQQKFQQWCRNRLHSLEIDRSRHPDPPGQNGRD